jgi:hypothetical protein
MIADRARARPAAPSVARDLAPSIRAGAHTAEREAEMLKIIRGAGSVVVFAAVLAVGAPAGAAGSEGDLTGNLPGTVYLLIPLVLVFAVLTALALGDRAEPRAPRHRAGGVTRALEHEPSESS